ncbi:MAG: RNA polymerase sigma-70 factor [Sediminicola sp.]|tara:strand:- start:74565 stop:75155 length:591 start_codon:yes stop_codon:yes gene_type:complete
MDLTDNTVLVELLKNGEERAYTYLLKTYHRRLHAYALTLVGDHAMAQDIVQNVFLKTWKFRHRLDGQFSVQGFLFKSVYNEFINDYQKNRSMMLLQQKYVESLADIVDQTEDRSFENMIAVVNREIGNLPPKCQAVFILSKKEGLTNHEISEHLSVSVKTVEAQITKAFGILREKLGARYSTIFMFIWGSPKKWTT